MKKSLSIIIPVYNVQNYLRDCIKSILAQNTSFESIEIILVDDGSTDDSGKICDEYTRKLNFVKVIHIKNSGQSAARNIGLEYATGNWVTYIDSDDIVRNGYIELISNIIQNLTPNEIVMFGFKNFESNFNLKRSNSKLEYKTSKLNSISKAEAMYDLTTSEWGNYLWNKVFPKKILEKFPLPIGQLYEDIAVMYKYFNACSQIKVYNENVYFYRQRKGSSVHLRKHYDQYISMIEAVDTRKRQLEFFENNNYTEAYNNAKYGLMLNSVSLIRITIQNRFKKNETFYEAVKFLKEYDCSIKKDGIKHYLIVKMCKFIL